MVFIAHFDEFYTEKISAFTCTLNFDTKYGRKICLKLCFSLGKRHSNFNASKCCNGNGGFKKGQWLIDTWQNLMCHL